MKKLLYLLSVFICNANAGECVTTQCIMAQAIENQQNEDERLNKNYAELKLHLKSDDFSALKAVQKKWIKLRDLSCSDEVYNKEDLGNEASIEKQLCLYNQTKARNIELESLTNDVVRENVNFAIQSVLSKVLTGADYERKLKELKSNNNSALFNDYVVSSCSLSKKVNNEDEDEDEDEDEGECVLRLNILR